MSAETNVDTPTHPDPAIPTSQPAISDKKAAADQPIAPEMPGTSSKPLSLSSLPKELVQLFGNTDTLIARLNKLLNAPGGQATLLSTLNYTLYILAYVHMKSPTRAQVITTISRLLGRPAPKVGYGALKPSEPSSPLIPLAGVISDTRTALRLFGLIPLYVGLTSTLRNRNPQDKILHIISITKLSGYIVFQALENILLLTNKGVLSPSVGARIGTSQKVMLYACRAWLCAITCDFLRLIRESQIASNNRAEGKRPSEQEQKEIDTKWWSDFLVASSWYPMALHYSVESGIGLNLGMVGLSGFGASVGNFARLWAATNK